MASGRFLHAPWTAASSCHGEKQLHPCPHERAFGGLQGQRRADNPAMKQGEQIGLSSPGLEQPQVLPEMSFYITQRREHCTAVLAFSIFSVTRALHSIWDLAASSLVPGVGGKQHGRTVCGCAHVPPPCTPTGTHPPAGPVGAGSGSPW